MIDLKQVRYDIGDAPCWLPKAIDEIKELRERVVALENELKTRMKIIVEKRSDDYMAYLEGRREIWDCGPYPSMAIGRLMISHKDVFGLEIEEVN